jgi:hypothetical protein
MRILAQAYIPCIRAGALALAICAIGCSDTQRIADASGVIRTNAESSKARFGRVETSALAANDRQIVTEARAGAKEQAAIIGATEAIVRALPGVKDATPWWATMLTYGLIALSVVGVVALLWMTGLGTFIKRLLAAAGMFIPAGERREANIAAKALNDDSDVTLREWIAVRRAQDPMFDAAYRREAHDRKIRTADAARRKPPADRP